jgi:DnaJ homolog subfamily C member 2
MSMLALPPSDPSLYDQSADGVVFVDSFHIPHMKRDRSDEEEEKSPSKKKGKKKGRKESSDSEYDDSEEQKMMKEKFHDEWEKKRKAKTSKEHQMSTLLVDDLYHTLGLEDLGLSATDQHIKTAYRKLALEYHPDKGTNSNGALDEEGKETKELNAQEKVKKEIWLKIQKAYETLMDPEKRRKYDSSLPFDESIPKEEDISEENFYAAFEPIFNRNAQWAKKKPVPQIGNEKTPIKKVLKFYKYWDSFETWRDFSCHDEYDLEEAGDKYEKRWMDKENQKIRSKYIKVERARLNELYRIAYRNDPRIKKYNLEQEQEKENKKKEKFEKKQKAREERMKKELEARQKMVDEEKKIEEEKVAQREQIEQQKQQRENLISALQSLADEKLKFHHPEYDKFFIQELVKKLTDECIKKLVDEVENMGDSEEEFQRVKSEIDQIQEKNLERIRIQQEKDKKKIEEKKEKKKEWSRDDFAILVKALNKYPPGTQDRWKTISTFMGTQYTSKDVIEMAKQLTEKKALANAGKGAFKNEPEQIIKTGD